MAKVYQLMADGFEEIEALAPVDILRRGEVDIQMVSITGTELVTSAHGVVIKTDVLFENADLSNRLIKGAKWVLSVLLRWFWAV